MADDHYIARADITDNVIRAFITASAASLDDYLEEADNFLEDLAQQLNVATASISTTGTPARVDVWVVKRLLIAYVCMRVAQDKAGTNNVETSPDLDKYYVKYDVYEKEVVKLKKQVTPEVLQDTVNDIGDRAQDQTSYLFRT